jgi:hypothetical protein
VKDKSEAAPKKLAETATDEPSEFLSSKSGGRTPRASKKSGSDSIYAPGKDTKRVLLNDLNGGTGMAGARRRFF